MLCTDITNESGHITISDYWSFHLNDTFKSRLELHPELGGFVREFWKPGFTIWVNLLTETGADLNEIAEIYKGRRLGEPYGIECSDFKEYKVISYRVHENVTDDRKDSFYIMAISMDSQMHLSIYFDDEADLILAEQIRNSIHYHGEGEFE